MKTAMIQTAFLIILGIREKFALFPIKAGILLRRSGGGGGMGGGEGLGLGSGSHYVSPQALPSLQAVFGVMSQSLQCPSRGNMFFKTRRWWVVLVK